MDSENHAFTDHSSYTTSLVSIIETSDSEEGVVYSRGERLLVVDPEDSSQLHQQATIGTLPDDVLLKIFKLFVDAMDCNNTASNEWHTLVHVCRRWRNLAFTSPRGPRHLNLQLLFRPHRRSVKEMLDLWPEIPIYIDDINHPSKQARDNIIAALRLNHRVSGVCLRLISDSAWEALGPLMQRPFPALTRLWVGPTYSSKNEISISRSFLGGSAPSLRDLSLAGITFTELPELLLSATNLVHLRYDDIPPSGHVSLQAMVTGLPALTRLETLSLMFQSPQSLPDRAIRIPPPHTARTLLPALTYLRFKGIPEDIQDLVAQLDTPLLESMTIILFHQEVLEISELAKFVHHADKLSLVNRAEVTFKRDRISVKLSEELLRGRVDPKTLILNPGTEFPKSSLQLSYLAHFCSSCLPTLSAFESLHIHGSTRFTWQDVVDHPNPQWPELLRLFHTVKDLRLSGSVARHVVQALKGLPVEQVTEVVPVLGNVFIADLELLGPVKEAISEFADARQLSGHPVSISNWNMFPFVTL